MILLLFESDLDEQALRQQLEQALEEAYGISAIIVLERLKS
ncbi:hypothetical protein [Paenibacillus harenae]|nr:hypothetical protein [Paenibacillus harenae]